MSYWTGLPNSRFARFRFLTNNRNSPLHAAPFGRAASIMRDGGDIANGSHGQSGGADGAHGGFPPAAGALHIDMYPFHPLIRRASRDIFRRQLRREGGAFFRPFESDGSGTCPPDHVPIQVRDAHDGIIEGGLDVGVALDHRAVHALTGFRGAQRLLARCFLLADH